MNLMLAVVAAAVALNPFRLSAVLPERDRRPVAIGGCLIALASLTLIAAVSPSVLDGLAVSTPSATIGAGAALIVVGIRAVLAPPPRPEPSLPGRRAALVPVAFPVLLDPAPALLVMAVAADRGIGAGIMVAGVGLGVGLLAGGWTIDPAWIRVGHGMVGTLAVGAGIAVTMSGVFDL